MPPVFRYQGRGGEILLFDLSSRVAPGADTATATVADTIEDLRAAPPVPPPALVLR
jgi:hypothetical protein